VKVEVVVHRVDKFLSVWEAAVYNLDARIISKQDDSWHGPWFLTFELQGDPENFARTLTEEFGSLITVVIPKGEVETVGAG
jgi:hypothetical protein